ncbi:hypothetical protein ElyMa_005119600, partial [Elysia marginata]
MIISGEFFLEASSLDIHYASEQESQESYTSVLVNKNDPKISHGQQGYRSTMQETPVAFRDVSKDGGNERTPHILRQSTTLSKSALNSERGSTALSCCIAILKLNGNNHVVEKVVAVEAAEVLKVVVVVVVIVVVVVVVVVIVVVVVVVVVVVEESSSRSSSNSNSSSSNSS